MAFEFKLPDIGEGVVEGEIVKWLVAAGDPIEIDQPMVEIMTDKATVVIPSPRKGRVAELRGAEGDFVAVGSVLLVIDEGEGLTPGDTEGARSKNDSPSALSPVRRVLAAPATRKLARESGVDLTVVRGTGPAGRITSEDVRRAQGEATADPFISSSPRSSLESVPREVVLAKNEVDEVVPIRGVRRRIWEGMTRAIQAPHFTFVEECDVTDLLRTRQRLNGLVEEGSARLTFLPFIVRAVGVALREFPDLNGHIDPEAQTFTRRTSIHLGIAVAAEQGLTVPVVRDANTMSLQRLAERIRELGEAVRGGRVKPADLGGSTFTITSLGKEGGLFATPIINHPEVAILGVHRLQKRIVVTEEDEMLPRSFINLSLSCDHRWIDGHVAARFAYRVIQLLENPQRLFLEMS